MFCAKLAINFLMGNHFSFTFMRGSFKVQINKRKKIPATGWFQTREPLIMGYLLYQCAYYIQCPEFIRKEMCVVKGCTASGTRPFFT